MNVLLVDDDPDFLRLIEHHLKKTLGGRANLIIESDSTKVGAILDETPVEVVVTDLEMVDQNGFHVLRAIKARNPLIQVVILTAHSTENAVKSALSMGADDFFTKPFEPVDLAQCVEYLGNRVSRWRSAVGKNAEVETVSSSC